MTSAALVSAAVILTVGCGGSATPETESAAKARQSSTNTPAQAAEVERTPPADAVLSTIRGSESSTFTFSTLLTAKSRVVVLSRVSGSVLSVYAEEGIVRKWRKGELLARIDPRSYDLAYMRASAEADRARAVYEHNTNASERFSGEFDVEIVSELDMEIARTGYMKAQADSALQKMQLDNTRIRAPIDGYITERRVQTGQWIRNQQELFTIVDIDTLWAVAVVPYSVLNALGPADIVTVIVDPGDEAFSVEGRLLLRNPVLLPPAGGTSGMKITIQLINVGKRLLPGMPAELVLHLP